MTILRILLMGLLFSTPLLAADKTLINVSNVSPGTYLLTVGVDGSVGIESVKVIEPDGKPPEPPQPPGGSIAGQVSKLVAAANDPEKATNIGIRWAMVAKLGESGVLTKPDQLRDAILGVHKDELSKMVAADKAKWEPILNDVIKVVANEEARIVDQHKRPWNMDEVVAIFEDVSKGFTGNAAMENIDLNQLFDFLLQLIKLLRELGIIPPIGGGTVIGSSGVVPMVPAKTSQRTVVRTINQLPKRNVRRVKR